MNQEIEYEVISYDVTESKGGHCSITECPYIPRKFVGSYYCACLCRYSAFTPEHLKVKCSYKFKYKKITSLGLLCKTQ